MDVSLLMEYGWVLLVLIALEGILAADNALALAIMVKHLPEEERKKALFYGLLGAFILRIGSLFIISFLVNVWQVQALGAAYLLFISLNYLFRKFVLHRAEHGKDVEVKEGAGFWMTVLKVELADVAFAVDSILAAVALAVSLPETDLPRVGGMDGGQFLVVLAGGLIGVIIMRFAASFFVNLLKKKPALETAAFLVVGWVGVKLIVITLAHPSLHIISEHFPESKGWKITFYLVLVAILVAGWFMPSKEQKEETAE
ncbi:TerC family protein [Salirhabdus salicampi]|uniref:TerC family protein n=1 Tax=Salirhabdus salicampi TaxID=476102 RepID=UPI0020C476B6|nr:TerC family protein [Salirhabdus salicampi]MCP8617371.1 TerC family protein [Salirhabdus salicampi]